MSHIRAELQSQPPCWERAVAIAGTVGDKLPEPGERVAVIGCGTSWFMAMAYAELRERAGHGETDAYAASQYPTGRRYDRVVLITRSGNTTEVLRLLSTLDIANTLIVGDPDSPAVALAGQTVALQFADERSVVQTRFATTALALLRGSLGEDLTAAIADARAAITIPLPLDPAGLDQVTFLGDGWTVGLAHEAALKCREAAGLWTEAYPAMEYRHGPIAIAQPGRAVWSIGEAPTGLGEDVRAAGAAFVTSGLDPMAELIVAQRYAEAAALSRGLNPDAPRSLTRSVVLA